MRSSISSVCISLWLENSQQGNLGRVSFITCLVLVVRIPSPLSSPLLRPSPTPLHPLTNFKLTFLPGGAYLAMYAMGNWPCATIPPLLLGTILEPLGITILASALNSNNLHLIYGMLALTGVGTGIRLMPGTLHGVGYFPKSISHIVSLMALANTLGGTLATTIMLNIFNGTLQKNGIDFGSASGDSESFDAIRGLAPADLAFFKEKATRGIVLAFYAITAFMWLGVLSCCGLGNVRIVGDEHWTIEGSWFGYLFSKRNGEGKVAEGAA